MSRAWPYFVASCAIVLADQITKWMVLGRLAPWERVEITAFFNLVLAFNKGAAFSFLAGAGGWQTPLLVAFALVAAVVVSVMLLRSPGRRMFCAGLALILGGAVGNVIDRLRYGHVVDFLDLHAGGWHWPAFNVADSAITVGAALLILDGFRHHERRAGAAS
jgi:signal peptidase II